MGLNIYDIIERYGPIVLSSPSGENSYLIQRNGSYLNLWVLDLENGGWNNVTCRGMKKDLYKVTGAQMIDEAKEWVKDLKEEGIYL
jgi:hypothetical protein